jgi:hypothetical protein
MKTLYLKIFHAIGIRINSSVEYGIKRGYIPLNFADIGKPTRRLIFLSLISIFSFLSSGKAQNEKNINENNVAENLWSPFNLPSASIDGTHVILTGKNKLEPLGNINVQFAPKLSANSLAVLMTSFNARSHNNSEVDLQWETKNEVNSNYFTIERSQDDVNFNAIAIILGSTNSARPRKYDYVDDLKGVDVTKPVNYRIKITDVNGKSIYSPVDVVTFASDQNLIKAYPNPGADNVMVYFTSDVNGSVKFIINDTKGKMIFAKCDSVTPGMNSVAINNLSTLPAGQYPIELDVNGKIIHTIKLIKN